MFGWLGQEVLGQNIADLLYVEGSKAEAVNALTIGRGGELVHSAKDHRELAIEGRCTLIRDAQGLPGHLYRHYRKEKS